MSKIKELVKGNTVQFQRVEFDEQCDAYWELEEAGDDFVFTEWFDSALHGETHYVPVETFKGRLVYSVGGFEFPIPFRELKGGRFKAEDKAIYFMRWIRKALSQ